MRRCCQSAARMDSTDAPSSRPEIGRVTRSEEHTSELQSPCNLVCRLLLEKKKQRKISLEERNNAFTLLFSRCRLLRPSLLAYLFFFHFPPPTETYPLSLHDALPICQ